jgi:hypothetical protein
MDQVEAIISMQGLSGWVAVVKWCHICSMDLSFQQGYWNTVEYQVSQR